MTTDQVVTLIAHSTTLPAALLSGGFMAIGLMRPIMGHVRAMKVIDFQQRMCKSVEDAVAVLLDPWSTPEQREGARQVVAVVAPSLLNSITPDPDPKKPSPGG